jgi:hypothetical protein
LVLNPQPNSQQNNEDQDNPIHVLLGNTGRPISILSVP